MIIDIEVRAALLSWFDLSISIAGVVFENMIWVLKVKPWDNKKKTYNTGFGLEQISVLS